MTELELIAAFALNLFFLFLGGLSLRIIFDEKFRKWFLKRVWRHQSVTSWWGPPLKKSKVKFLKMTNEGTLLAGAALIALIFLPIGSFMLIALIINAITMLLQ